MIRIGRLAEKTTNLGTNNGVLTIWRMAINFFLCVIIKSKKKFNKEKKNDKVEKQA